MSEHVLTTPRLRLVFATGEMVQADRDNRERLGNLLGARIADGWPTEYWDAGAMEWTIKAIESNTTANGWGMWYWALMPPAIDVPTLVGNGGFKGRPDDKGVVEIGYAIVNEHRRRGLATEASIALLQWAFKSQAVQRVDAETFPELIASIGVMKKLGMRFLGPGSESRAIRYGVTREQFAAAPG